MLSPSAFNTRVAVADLERVKVDEMEAAPAGEHLSKVGDRAAASIRRSMAPEGEEPEVEGLPGGSSFCSTFHELSTRLSAISAWVDSIRARSKGGDLFEAEYDQGKKIGLMRGKLPGWFVEPEGFVRHSDASIDEELKAMAHSLRVGTAPRPDNAPRYKMGTSHGYPDYLTSDTSFMLHAFMARAVGPDYGALSQLMGEVAGILGEQDTPMSAMMHSRTGPIAKPQRVWDITVDGPRSSLELTSACPRRRKVRGAPSAGNMVQLWHMAGLKEQMKSSPEMYTAAPQDVLSFMGAGVDSDEWIWLADDISSFDLSVAREHQVAVYKHVYGPAADAYGGDAAAFAQYKMDWAELPLLAGALTSLMAAFLYGCDGTTASGDYTTASDGSWINVSRVVHSVARACGWTVAQCLERKRTHWKVKVQGDDTLFGIRRGVPFNEHKYVDGSEELGYRCKLSGAATFLMKFYSEKRNSWTPLATRVVQQTVFNEYGGISLAAELFSFMARTPGEFWVHNPLAHEVEALLGDGPCFKEYGVTPSTATQALGNPKFLRDLEATTRARPRYAEHLPDMLASRISDLAASLLKPEEHAALPNIDRETARTVALKIAGWMAIPREDRKPITDVLASIPEAVDYSNYIKRGDHT